MRQESHRVYLQTFAPRSPSSSAAASGGSSSPGSSAPALAASVASAQQLTLRGGGVEGVGVLGEGGARPGPPPPSRPSVHTASAAIRLTDGATAEDVTRLLRAKFGWPPLPRPRTAASSSSPPKRATGGGGGGSGGGDRNSAVDRINARLAVFQRESAGSGSCGDGSGGDDSGDGGSGSPPVRTIAVASSPSSANVTTGNWTAVSGPIREGENDALVLVGTVVGLPRNYVRFEHELEEDDGVPLELSPRPREPLPGLGDIEYGNSGGVTGPDAVEAAEAAGEPSWPAATEVPDTLPDFTHEGPPERRRIASIASATTIKASGAVRETSDGGWGGSSALDLSLSVSGDLLPGLDLSGDSRAEGRTGAGLDASQCSLGPLPASSSLSTALESAEKGVQNGREPVTPPIRNGPQSRHHRRISSGDGLSTSRRNGTPVSSPGSSWAHSLIGVPRGGVGTIVTEGQQQRKQQGRGDDFHRATAAQVRADIAAVAEIGRGYAHGLDKPGLVGPSTTPNLDGHPFQGDRGRHHRRRHHSHQHRHHHQEELYAASPEPYNLVRTLWPHENPLLVRDEVLRTLTERQRLAEVECGVPPRRRTRVPTFRWFFQPRAGAGGCGGDGGRIRNVPSCVNVDGYCSGAESDDDDDGCGGGGGAQRKDSVDGVPENDWLFGVGDDVHPNEEKDDHDIVPFWRFDVLDRYGRQHRYSGRPDQWKERDPLCHCPNAGSSRLADERHKLTILSQREGPVSGGDGQCVSGYLLKRSRSDPNVWRRVHCILTDDQLWYVTRVRPLDDWCTDGGENIMKNVGAANAITTSRSWTAPDDDKQSRSTPTRGQQPSSAIIHGAQTAPPKPDRIGRHRVVHLASSLLLESDPASVDSTPLSRTPHAFEICTARGEAHVFRAPRRSVQRRWVECLGARIARCHEDSLVELADLIVAEETRARGRRMMELVARPVIEYGACAWVQRRRSGLGLGPDQAEGEASAEHLGAGPLLTVVRFAAEVAEYRELCRRAIATDSAFSHDHVPFQERTKNPHHNGELTPLHVVANSDKKRAERRCQDLTLASWEAAEDVLSKSHPAVRALKYPLGGHGAEQKDGEDKQDAGENVGAELTRAWSEVATVQKYISDMVEEGRVRILVGGVGSSASSSAEDDNDEPRGENKDSTLPPLELFDALLSKLQHLASQTPCS